MDLALILAALGSRVYFGTREFERLLAELVQIRDLCEFTRSEPLQTFLRTTPNWYETVVSEIETLLKIGAEILFWGHPKYPPHFLDLERPPLFLACWGDTAWISKKLLAVVGSRNPSRETLAWMDRELPSLAEKGVIFVSGGAYGVDQKAHAMSLRASSPTVVFLPSGFNQIYPHTLKEWVAPIQKNGGVFLTEFLPSVQMQRHFFCQRNRLIAALSDLVFVVEARRKSGSLMTAGQALRIGRDICVLPSRPSEIGAVGTLDLLCEGAWPVRDALDLELLLGSVPSQRKLHQASEPLF